ncbi:RNA polymerase sigma-70 factor [Ureibacillus xyleni]|uniref:RNA polymerase sigma factor n=1 Tax=Ureibacillus xyleni TaxID=614648 RepID=A0A285TMA1_9BACL|nr:RNA polymerase sigma factor [Ureibacillus xyleni]SOC23852.1 RNA polymerase sigma-70 factor [Ureibacillus xyleni]
MDQLYREHNRTIFKYIFYLVQNESIAEDLLQDTFLKAYKNYNHFRNEASELTWLRKIARNVVYDYLRRKKIIQFIPFLNKHEQTVQDDAMQYILENEARKALFDALSKLKVHHREVLILRKIEQLSIEETAQILGWNTDKVKNTQRQAINTLRKIWEGVENVEY